MKFFRRSKQESPAPDRRRVSGVGRTMAYAYHANRSEEQATLGRSVFRQALEKRVKKKQRRQLRRQIGLGLVLVAITVGLGYVLGLSTSPAVRLVDDNQAPLLRPLGDYQRAATIELNRSLFNHNKITVNTAAVSATLKRQFPELHTVNITLSIFSRQPTMYLAPADPVLALSTTDNHTYVIDSTGRVMAPATAATVASLHLVAIKDMSGTPIQLGQRVLAGSSMDFIQTMLYQLQQKHMAISTLVLPAATSEVDLYLAGQEYYGKFNLASGTAREQVGTFLAVKHYLEGKGQVPREYIDVRVDGRAYYR